MPGAGKQSAGSTPLWYCTPHLHLPLRILLRRWWDPGMTLQWLCVFSDQEKVTGCHWKDALESRKTAQAVGSRITLQCCGICNVIPRAVARWSHSLLACCCLCPACSVWVTATTPQYTQQGLTWQWTLLLNKTLVCACVLSPWFLPFHAPPHPLQWPAWH
jgi:hypothetical protein